MTSSGCGRVAWRCCPRRRASPLSTRTSWRSFRCGFAECRANVGAAGAVSAPRSTCLVCAGGKKKRRADEPCACLTSNPLAPVALPREKARSANKREQWGGGPLCRFATDGVLETAPRALRFAGTAVDASERCESRREQHVLKSRRCSATLHHIVCI